MTEVSEVSKINPRSIVLPIAFRCLCPTDIGSTCACWVNIPIFKAMMEVAIAHGRDMWDPVIRVSAAIETRCVRAGGFVGIVDEGSESRVACARLAQRVDSDIIKNRRKLCGGKRSERATQAE
jgi:hypothetical protein